MVRIGAHRACGAGGLFVPGAGSSALDGPCGFGAAMPESAAA